MANAKLPDWNKYWAKIKDINKLLLMSSNMDQTLLLIEKEYDCKLLSGDHIMIIEALENRVEELQNELNNGNVGIQADLFE